MEERDSAAASSEARIRRVVRLRTVKSIVCGRSRRNAARNLAFESLFINLNSAHGPGTELISGIYAGNTGRHGHTPIILPFLPRVYVHACVYVCVFRISSLRHQQISLCVLRNLRDFNRNKHTRVMAESDSRKRYVHFCVLYIAGEHDANSRTPSPSALQSRPQVSPSLCGFRPRNR